MGTYYISPSSIYKVASDITSTMNSVEAGPINALVVGGAVGGVVLFTIQIFAGLAWVGTLFYRQFRKSYLLKDKKECASFYGRNPKWSGGRRTPPKKRRSLTGPPYFSP